MGSQSLNGTEQRYMDINRQINISLWNALLTVNGVLVGIFSILALVIGEIGGPLYNLIWLCLICCMSSLVLIVWNFSALQKVYFKIGKVISEPPASLSNEQKRKNVQHAQRIHRHNKLREFIVKTLLFVELVLVVLILTVRRST